MIQAREENEADGNDRTHEASSRADRVPPRDLYGAWRLLTVFEASDRCVLLLVAEHTRSANPYQLLYAALGIAEPDEPRTKPQCCDSDGQPPIDPDVVVRFERGLRDLGRGLPADGKARRKRRH
jgi:hypothetical protein